MKERIENLAGYYKGKIKISENQNGQLIWWRVCNEIGMTRQLPFGHSLSYFSRSSIRINNVLEESIMSNRLKWSN